MRPHLILAAGVLLAACTQRSPRPLTAVASPPQPPTRTGALLDGAVAVSILLPSEHTRGAPVVISAPTPPAAWLAAGFVVVSYHVDWARLGEALPPPTAATPTAGQWMLASPSPRVLGRAYLRGVTIEATRILPRIMDHLVTLPEVDARRIGIAGASTSGLVALRAVTEDRRFAAAAVVAACGDYHQLLQYSGMGMAGGPLALDPAYERWLRRQEPTGRSAQLPPTALLMLNRVIDPFIPIACADETARRAAAAYRAVGMVDRFHFVRIPQEGHAVADLEATQVRAWFDRWLLRGADAASG